MKNYRICSGCGLALICGFVVWLSFGTVYAGKRDESSNPVPVDLEYPDLTKQSGRAGANDLEMALEAASYTDFLRISGAALKPRESNVEWTGASGAGGCIYASSGSSTAIFNVPVTLPQGSNISYFRIYYNDTNVNVNSVAWFTIYDLYGEVVEEWSVSSNGSSGNGYQTTAQFSHTVDYGQYSYMINWRPYELGSDMQICGFRLYYTPPEPPESPERAVFFPIGTKQQ